MELNVSASNTEQRTMNFILNDLRDFCLVFIDDIVIFSSNIREHLKHIDPVMQRLRKKKLFAKRSTCTFCQAEIEYVVLIVGHGGIITHYDKLEAISSWPVLQIINDVLSFL